MIVSRLRTLGRRSLLQVFYVRSSRSTTLHASKQPTLPPTLVCSQKPSQCCRRLFSSRRPPPTRIRHLLMHEGVTEVALVRRCQRAWEACCGWPPRRCGGRELRKDKRLPLTFTHFRSSCLKFGTSRLIEQLCSPLLWRAGHCC